jgi:hypothetical protein
MSNSANASSPEEKKQRLIELEQKIAHYTFVDRGVALAEIHENELYIPAFSSFEEYCVSRWDFKRAQGYRLIDAAAVAKALSPIGDIRKESHARALLEFPPERRAEVWKGAIEHARAEGRRLTAADIYDQLDAKPEVKASEPAIDVAVTLDQLRDLWEKSTRDVRTAFLEWAALAPKKSENADGTPADGNREIGRSAPIESRGAGETPVTSPTPEVDEEEPQYECDNCGETFDDDSEAVTLYECGDCCERFTRDTSPNGNHQCPRCNKFGHRVSNCGCPICNEGELIKNQGENE